MLFLGRFEHANREQPIILPKKLFIIKKDEALDVFRGVICRFFGIASSYLPKIINNIIFLDMYICVDFKCKPFI